MTAYKTEDENFIRKMVMHPEIKPFMFPFDVPVNAPFNMKKIFDKEIIVYAIVESQMPIGIGVVSIKDSDIWIDIAFIPEVRGKKAVIFATETLNCYIAEYKPRILYAKIRRNNLKSRLFAGWFNFECFKQDEMYFYMRRQFYG